MKRVLADAQRCILAQEHTRTIAMTPHQMWLLP
jgi:hypothetical protein